MTSVRAGEVARTYKTFDDLPPLVLVFGPDRGLVTEIAARLAALFGADDPFALVRLDGATVAADPARLTDEARTVSLFGGRRLVWVRDGASRNLAPALTPLLAEPPRDAVVLVEAGDLRRGTGIRKMVESDPSAAALYCPPDDEKALERMIEEEARAFQLTVDADARAALRDNLGADRGASRSEIQKVCLHAAGTGRLTLSDVEAVATDVASAALGEAIDAAFLGQRQRLEPLLSRVLAETAPSSILYVAQTTSHTLEAASVAVARGTAPARAVEAVRPPLYGARKAAAARILERWDPPDLRHASALFAQATFTTRIRPALAAAVVRDAFYRIVSHRG